MNEFFEVFLYVTAFGLSDLFLRVCKITSVHSLFFYYIAILSIAFFIFYKDSTPITHCPCDSCNTL